MGNHFIKKYTLDDILKAIEDKGLSYVSGDYINTCSTLTLKDKEGYKCLQAISVIMKPKSTFKKFDRRNPYAKENIELWIKLNCENRLVEFKEYLGQDVKNIVFNCEKHGNYNKSWNLIYEGKHRCPICTNSISITLEEAKKRIYERNPNVEILSSEYVNAYTKMDCKCKVCGNTWESTYHNLYYHGCPECKRRKLINTSLTKEEREIGRNYPEYRKFVIAVLKRDNYTCQLTGYKGDDIAVHHIDGYNWCKEKRTDVSNGIVLNADIHRKFHSIYGYGDNTKEQFEEFCKQFKK